jgi:dienelactone hydrolase
VRRLAHTLAAVAVACLSLTPSLAVEQELPTDFRLNETVLSIPAGKNQSATLQTTVYRPNGAGPFPLLIINHGKEAGAPSAQARDRFIIMATAFVKRGYAVMVPMRQGYAGSTGTYADHGCNMTANGHSQAADVLDVLAFAREQTWIDDAHIVIAGQSYGGLATIALGTRRLAGVRGLINFAGGLRDDSAHCDWRAELVRAFGTYGARNQIASLWLYGYNDSLFGPALVARMHDAFVHAGGRARLFAFGDFKRDAHGLLASRDGEKIWGPETDRFLRDVGMPTALSHAVSAAPALPKSNFARIDDIAAVPYLSENGRAAYRAYLAKMTPRAFAVSPSGAWSWAEEGEDPDARALAACANKSKQHCQLYSVDDYVVWPATLTASAKANTSAATVGGNAAGAPQ